jgi:hypothetical protein
MTAEGYAETATFRLPAQQARRGPTSRLGLTALDKAEPIRFNHECEAPMKHEADTRVERRNRAVHTQTTVARRGPRIAPTTILRPCGLARPTRRESGAIKSLWVIVLVVPVVIAVLVVAMGVLGIVARLVPH